MANETAQNIYVHILALLRVFVNNLIVCVTKKGTALKAPFPINATDYCTVNVITPLLQVTFSISL